MLTHPTLDHLKALRLDGMAEAFADLQAQDSAADLGHAEWLGLLVDREVASRETKCFEARMRSARLRHVGACPEDVDYRARRGLDKALFQSLLTGRWITDKRGLIITGPCGVGKTWLGCALAQAACRDGVTVVYKRMLVEERYGRGSTMITSQLPITAWHDVIGEPTFADAILDRIVHNAYRIELEGQSMRKTIAKMDDETPQT